MLGEVPTRYFGDRIRPLGDRATFRSDSDDVRLYDTLRANDAAAIRDRIDIRRWFPVLPLVVGALAVRSIETPIREPTPAEDAAD